MASPIPGQYAMYQGKTPEPVVIISQDGSGNLYNINESNPLPVDIISGGGGSESPIVAGTAPTPVAVGTTNTPIVSDSPTREMLWLQNTGPNTAYIQHTEAAVLANAFPFKKDDVLLLEGRFAKLAWNGICASAESASIRILPGTVL